MRTNCPNCGAPLKRDGSCEYCGTIVKQTNELDIFYNGFSMDNIELTLNINDKENKTVFILPLIGKIDELTIHNETIDAVDILGHRICSFIGNKLVDFTFCGWVNNESI